MTKPRILIVEDEPFVARDIQQQLVKLGYEPVAYTPLAEEAVSLAEQLRPDLVLMDIHLEGEMDGIAAAQIIHDRFDLPVVLLMSSAAEETLDLAKKSEPFGTIIKPFGEQELRMVIEMALYKHQSETQIRQIRKEQAVILRTIPDGIVISRLADSLVLEVNDSFCRLSGLSREEVIGRTMPELDLWDQQSDRNTFLKSLREQGRVEGMEAGFHNKSGGHRIIALSAEVMDQDQEKRVLIIARDITERKRTEAALRENEDLYHDLVDNSHELVTTYDLEGNLLSVNETAIRNTGYPREALLKMNLMDLIVPEMRHALPEYLRTIRTLGKAHGIMRIQIANGETRFWEYDATVRTEGVAMPIVRGMALDITGQRRAEKALRVSESQLQVILESTGDGILAVDLQGKILKTNSHFADLWKIPESLITIGDDQALLDHVLDQVSDPDAFLKKIQSVYTSNATDLDEIHFKDGRCFERFSSPMLEGVVVTGRVWSFRDITERKRTEEALRENEDRYRDLVDNSQELISTYDLDGNFLSVNETTIRLSGYPREALLKMNLSDLVVPKMRHLFPEYLRTIRTFGKAKGIMRIQTAKGEMRFWEYDTTLRTAGVAVPIVRGMALDITERLHAEKALRASEETLRMIIEHSVQLFYSHTPDNLFTYISPQVNEFFDTDREGTYRPWIDFLTDNPVNAIGLELSHQAIETGERQHPYELELLSPRGRKIWVEVHESPVVEQGKTIAMVGALTDITESKEVGKRTADLRTTVATMQIQERELRQREAVARAASEAKSTFLAAMSHELRTPLIGVTGMLEVLTQSDLDAQQRQVVAVIHESSESLLQIIGDILDFSKIEANKLELAPQTFSARALMESVSHTFSSALSAKGLKFVVKVDPRVAPAHVADAMRIRQILNNFMSNAVKFTESGSITLRLVRLGSHNGHESLAFEVQDTGIGVSPESLAKLFEPFTQAEASTTRRFGGTGLGLVISQRLAKLMGGSLDMQSTLGQGTTLTLAVDLPIGDERDIVKPAVLDASEAMPLRPAPSIEEAMQERSLVLMAEDHPTNRTVLTQQVNRAGYALEVAVDGQEAFEKWQSGRYSLILTDLHMPRLDGYQLTKAVRDWEREHGSPRTPILALTANALGGEAERCLELGMDDYLIKPVTIPLLAFKLHQWMPHVKLGQIPEALATPSSKTVEGMPGLDSKTLLDLCGGDAASAQEILNDFIETTKADLLVMQDGLRQKDKPCIVRQSHRIKGSSSMIGARDLANRATKLEAYAKTETAEWETMQEHWVGIQEALKALARAG